MHEKKHIVMPTDPLEAAALAPQPGGTYIDKLVADTVRTSREGHTHTNAYACACTHGSHGV